MLYAADVVRDSSGQWLVLRDHTDAPTGCGYALMNRDGAVAVVPRAVSAPRRQRLCRDGSPICAPPCRRWRPPSVVGPRAILLGPDPQRPGFVEASYLAAHLGYHLASSGDLITRGGRVWLRTLGGLEQIDVVFRRLVDTGSDPLELRPAGTGGVTGLLQAVREGHVGVANSLGSGVADPSVVAAVPRRRGAHICSARRSSWRRSTRGGAATAIVSRLCVPTRRRSCSTTPTRCRRRRRCSVIVSSDAEMHDWLDRMTAAPHRYVVQPKIEFASTPVAIDGELRNGTASIRVQTVRIGDEVVVLPGGHGRHVVPGPAGDQLA